MGRHSAGFRAAGAGSTLLPSGSLYAPAGNRLHLQQVIVSNTAAVAVAVAIRAITTTGTQGSAIVEIEHDNEGLAPTGTVFNTHTSTGPTITAGEYDRVTLPGVIGATFVFEFGPRGLFIPAGTGNGIGAVIAVGAGQIMDISFTWDE